MKTHLETYGMSAKERNEKIKNYLLDAIDLEGRNLDYVPLHDFEKLQEICNIFKSEYWYEENQRYYKNNMYLSFANWLMGLPSCFNIDFENYKILEIAEAWGCFHLGRNQK